MDRENRLYDAVDKQVVADNPVHDVMHALDVDEPTIVKKRRS